MNKHEKIFTEWLEKEKAERGLVYVKYATTGDCDVTSEEFFIEANAMNEAEAVVVDGTENFPRYSLKEILGSDKLDELENKAMDIAIANGKYKELIFDDATGK